MTELDLDAAVNLPMSASAHEVACPLCGGVGEPRLRDHDRKADRELFEFLGLPAGASQWTVCAGCGFVDQNPRPDPDRMIALYERGLYREQREYSEHFFRNRYRFPVEHYRWLAGRADVRPGARILDIGAGFGGVVRAFRDLGAYAEGTEADPRLCEAARTRRFGVELRPGDVETAPLGEAAWDVIYSVHTHEHFAGVIGVTPRLGRLLVPGGHPLIVLPTVRFGARNAQGLLNGFHLSMFTARTLARLFVLTGFEPVAFRHPLEHSRPEVWGIARRVEGGPRRVPRGDAAGRVAWEIERAPALFERIYGVTDRPLRGGRALHRRLEGPRRWPEWTGTRP